MNVLILTPDRVGSTLLQRLYNIKSGKIIYDPTLPGSKLVRGTSI